MKKFPKKIALIGAPNTGKTTLARDVAKTLRSMGHKASAVPEGARFFITKKGPQKTTADDTLIARRQHKYETSHFKKSDIIVTDSPIFLNFLYMTKNAKKNMSRYNLKNFYLKNLGAKINEKDFLNRYDLVFLLDHPKNMSWNYDPGRMHNKEEALQIQKKIVRFLKNYGIPHKKLKKDHEYRVRQVVDAIKNI